MTDEENVSQSFSKELNNGFCLIAQHFYDMGRDHEKKGESHMNIVEEYARRKEQEKSDGRVSN